jgi:tetratricopeptide (TPR) repeat protein
MVIYARYSYVRVQYLSRQRKGVGDGMADPTSAINIFYSYAHEDAELRDKLDKHLAAMQRNNLIVGWHDRDIHAGIEWKKEINEHLDTAQIILLLISSDFIASDYCYSIEMKRAMERHERGEACVIPIILRPVDTEGTPFSKLEMLPTDMKPVTDWPNQDSAFVNIAQGIRKIVKNFPAKTKEQWLAEGLTNHKAGHYEQALRAFDQAMLIDPDYARAYRSKGDVLYDLKHYEEALAAYGQAIRLDPDHARIYSNRGDILRHLKRYEEALTAYEQAIRLEPNLAPNYNEKGNVLFSLKRYEEALAAYEAAIRLDPGFASAYNNMGNALSRLKRYFEADIAYEQAIRLNPQYAIPYNNKGRALYHLGRYHEALEAFERAIGFDRNFKEVYANMADVLERLGRIEEARAARAKA